MNALRTVSQPHPANETDTLSARTRTESRPPHRERDFGVGYGNSSGYAAANDRRYAQSWAKTLFRCS
jgi:hypothetical protein